MKIWKTPKMHSLKTVLCPFKGLFGFYFQKLLLRTIFENIENNKKDVIRKLFFAI